MSLIPYVEHPIKCHFGIDRKYNLFVMSSRKFNTKRSNEMPDVGMHHDGSAAVYMMHKISKLREINTSNVKTKSDIFTTCIIFVNGVTNPPVEELRRLIGIHGGECVNYRVSGLTHFVCDYFTDAQLKHEYSKKRINNSGSLFNVRAQWVVDSIREGRRLDEILYLPDGLQGQFGRPITSHFVKASESIHVSVDNAMESASSSMKLCASSDNSINSNSSSSGGGNSSSFGIFSSSDGGIRNKSNNTFENSPYDNNQNIIDCTVATTSTLGTATTSSSTRDSPSALGLTLSQEDFIRSVPLDEFQDEIFEQLIQFNLSKKAAKQLKNSGSDGIAASEKRPVEEVGSIVETQCEARLAPVSSSKQPPRPRAAGNRDQSKRELQEMVSWIHRVEQGSTGVVLRLLCYTEQLIHSFSGYTLRHRHPQETEEVLESALCLPTEYHYGVLQSYGVWLLQNDQFDNLSSFIRQLRKVCRSVTAEESLPGEPLNLPQRSYFEWQEQWNQVPLQVEEHIQRQAASKFRCKIALD